MPRFTGKQTMDLANREAEMLDLPMLVERSAIKRISTPNGDRDLALFTVIVEDPEVEGRRLTVELTRNNLLCMVAGMQLGRRGMTSVLDWQDDDGRELRDVV